MKQAFKLYKPLVSDEGTPITTLTAALLTLGQNNQADTKATDDLTASDLRVMAVTGLSEDELNRLAAPDFNSLASYVEKQRTQPTAAFLGNKQNNQNNQNADSPTLIQPISANGGEQVNSLTLKVPTVKMIRMRDKVEGDLMTRALWLTAACTDVGPDDLLSLAMPDWIQLQMRLGDFLQQPAAYFRSGT